MDILSREDDIEMPVLLNDIALAERGSDDLHADDPCWRVLCGGKTLAGHRFMREERRAPGMIGKRPYDAVGLLAKNRPKY
jgi:hypothetical protein